MDVRVKAYFVFTTLNSLFDVIAQVDDTIFCLSAFLWRIVTMVALLYAEETRTTLVTIAMTMAHASSALYWMYKAPHTWEANLWSVQTDLVMMIWMLLTTIPSKQLQPQPHDASILCTTIHEMFSCYYCAAAFFKMNTHFLDPDGSCATMFMAQHTTYFLSPYLSLDSLEHLLRLSKPWAPIATIAVESVMGGTIALGRMLNSRTLSRLGLMVILYFHLMVCLTPKPNDISNFALICGSRLILLLDAQSLEVLAQRIRPYLIHFTAIIFPIVSYGVHSNFTPMNWAFLFYAHILILCQWATHIECQQKIQAVDVTNIIISRPMWTKLATVFAASYSFGSIVLGLQEEATPNMVPFLYCVSICT
jgi:hypothetical protein